MLKTTFCKYWTSIIPGVFPGGVCVREGMTKFSASAGDSPIPSVGKILVINFRFVSNFPDPDLRVEVFFEKEKATG